MKEEVLSVLLGYFNHQLEVIEKLFREVKVVSSGTSEKTIRLGYVLHNLYCALEDLFQEIAKSFENRVEDPTKYHRELLKRMSLEIPGIRPQVVSDGSFPLLDELRGFRHIFRHSYDYQLSKERVEVLRKRVLDHWQAVEADLGAFRDFLEEKIKKR